MSLIWTILFQFPVYLLHSVYGMPLITDSNWSSWSPWSPCISTLQFRIRSCQTIRGFTCTGGSKERRPCVNLSDLSRQGGYYDTFEQEILDEYPIKDDRDYAMEQLGITDQPRGLDLYELPPSDVDPEVESHWISGPLISNHWVEDPAFDTKSRRVDFDESSQDIDYESSHEFAAVRNSHEIPAVNDQLSLFVQNGIDYFQEHQPDYILIPDEIAKKIPVDALPAHKPIKIRGDRQKKAKKVPVPEQPHVINRLRDSSSIESPRLNELDFKNTQRVNKEIFEDEKLNKIHPKLFTPATVSQSEDIIPAKREIASVRQRGSSELIGFTKAPIKSQEHASLREGFFRSVSPSEIKPAPTATDLFSKFRAILIQGPKLTPTTSVPSTPTSISRTSTQTTTFIKTSTTVPSTESHTTITSTSTEATTKPTTAITQVPSSTVVPRTTQSPLNNHGSSPVPPSTLLLTPPPPPLPSSIPTDSASEYYYESDYLNPRHISSRVVGNEIPNYAGANVYVPRAYQPFDPWHKDRQMAMEQLGDKVPEKDQEAYHTYYQQNNVNIEKQQPQASNLQYDLTRTLRRESNTLPTYYPTAFVSSESIHYDYAEYDDSLSRPYSNHDSLSPNRDPMSHMYAPSDPWKEDRTIAMVQLGMMQPPKRWTSRNSRYRWL